MVMPQKLEGYEVDIGGIMKDIFHSGTNYITEGTRGGGKTFTAVSYSYCLVNGLWPEVGKVVLLTNIIFLKRIHKTRGDPKEDFTDKETPPNVYHVDTMEGMFRTITALMKQNPDRDVLYLIVLDEAQNFFNSYEAMSDVSREMQKWFGTLRKFDACLWMLTPSIMNVPPKGRSFNDDPKPGYLNGIWSKNPVLTRKFLDAHNLDDNVNQWTMIKFSHNDNVKRFFKVPMVPWTKDYKSLKVGEYCYDHLASADFTMGSKGFSFPEMVTRISNSSSLWMADALDEFFNSMDMAAEGDDFAEKYNQALDRFLMVKEMDKLGISTNNQSKILHTPESTLRLQKESLYERFSERYCSDDEFAKMYKALKKNRGKIPTYIEKRIPYEVKQEKTCEVKSEASISRSDQNGGCEGVEYISLGHKASEEGEEAEEAPKGPLGVPDGTYSIDELAAAGKYCLGKDEEEN